MLLWIGQLASGPEAFASPPHSGVRILENKVIELPGNGRKEISHYLMKDGVRERLVREELHFSGDIPSGRGKRVCMLADQFVIEVLSNKKQVVESLENLGYLVSTGKSFSNVLVVQLDRTGIVEYQSALSQLRRLARNGQFIVSPDYLANVEATIPDDPDFESSQPDLQLIGAVDAWDIVTGDSRIVVAIIDTGIQADHEDLSGNLFVNPHEVSGNGIDDDGNGLIDDVNGWNFLDDNSSTEDLNGHGTSMAGVIGAIGNNSTGITGTLWDCQLLPLKAGNAILTWSAIVTAIDYAIWLKQQGVRLVAINNSYAGEVEDDADLQLLSNAVSRCEEAGILFVAAAGNNGRNNDEEGGLNHLYPADLPHDNILTVAATNNNDELLTASNFGETSIDIAAPGASVFSTRVNNTYGASTGTSFSCARATGLVSLIYAQNPELSALDVKQLIIATGVTVLDLLGKLRHPVRIDAGAALQSALTLPVAEWPDGLSKRFLRSGDPYEFEVSVSDADGYVTAVDFIIDGTIVSTDANGVDGWNYTWANPTGEGSLQVRVTDDSGQQITSWVRRYEVVNDFDFWRYGYWGQNFTTLASAAIEADPDFDGIGNLWEYATGGNPSEAAGRGVHTGLPEAISFTINETFYFGVEYRLRTSDPALQLFVEGNSRPLGNDWSIFVMDYSSSISDPGMEGFENIRLGYKAPFQERQFLRLMLKYLPDM